MNNIKKLAGQTAIYGLSSILGRLLNYLLTPLYTYSFVTEQYGVYTELYAYTAFLVVLLTYGMETAYFRFTKSDYNPQDVYKTSLFSILASTLVFFILGLTFADNIGSYLSKGSINLPYSLYVSWFVLIIGFDAISAIPFAKLRNENKALKFATIKLLGIASNIAFNLFFILWCPKIIQNEGHFLFKLVNGFYHPEYGIAYAFIANLISSTLTLILLIPQFKLTGKFILPLWKKMIKYALPLLVLGFAGIINENIDRVLLKNLLPYSPEKNLSLMGIYGACYKVSIIMTIFIQAFRYAAEPFFFSQLNNSNAKETYAKVFTYFAIVCSIIFLGVMLNIDWLIKFVGPEFRTGKSIIPILLLANMFLGLFYNLSIWYKLTDKTIYGAYISIIGALITLVLNYLWIPHYGYTGSAWATLVCYFSMFVLSYLLGQRYYPVKYNLIKVGAYMVSAIAVFVIVNYLGNTINLFLKNIFLILFIAIIYLLERPKKVVISRQ
ncbi:MAG: polysaccharide biosynthesis C-terminal domain-containing protein [Vicingaceae bacterium]